MRIFADSASDLPKSFFEQNDVTLLPLRVLIDDVEYEDILTIDPLEVYKAIQNGKQPKTSQVSPEFFKEKWEELAVSGEEGIYIAFSSELSGTHDTAVMIQKQVLETNPNLNLTIIDSKCASLGLGLLVQEAVKLRYENVDRKTIIQRIQFMAKHMEHLFTVQDLDYMARGGRVSKTSAFVGGLLNIKPLLHVEGGKLVPIEKHRGRKKVLRRMMELVAERGDHLAEQTIAISHSNDPEIAMELKSMIEELFRPKHIGVYLIGSTIGSHVGPGTVSVYFLNQLKEG